VYIVGIILALPLWVAQTECGNTWWYIAIIDKWWISSV